MEWYLGLLAIGFASTSHKALEYLIRQYYVSLYPPAALYFGSGDPGAGTHGVRYGRWSFFFTMASMVIAVNSVVGGATVALVCALAARAPSPAPRSSSSSAAACWPWV